ncbi:hypothetical protein [Streptomyces lancefieldiae]|uniref:Uncharacterized protein n=1 Tax=Streptomyces lancefieldiae TaxID=3075520 RepID=A0ABU3AGR5_9ACTN|nr:hypothetical protein [Streptomyces sp. DSM 40712]MDT0609090.1 hypothetical protein [Streptomyces sp. DSM 40712]
MTSDALVGSTFQVVGVLTRIGAERDLLLTQLRVSSASSATAARA